MIGFPSPECLYFFFSLPLFPFPPLPSHLAPRPSQGRGGSAGTFWMEKEEESQASPTHTLLPPGLVR